MNSIKSKKKHQKRTSQNTKAKKNQCGHKEEKDEDKNDGIDSGHGDSDAAISTTPECLPPTPVDKMTSREFQFDTSAHIEMLDQMLKDKVRIQTYKAAIIHNQHLFKGKIVLDIGCGIGILSLFAAKAGAAKVYAIDTSNVIYYTRKIVAANGYENIIEVVKGDIQKVDLPVKEVDIIVSDWIGYALLFQSKCRSVIYARDKWLKPGGLIFPDQGKLFVVAVEDGKHKNDNIEWWKSVYGFNMRCLREAALREPRHHLLKASQVLSNHYLVKALDLYTATVDDLGFRSRYMLPIQKNGRMDGIALYFHIYFTKSHTPLGFSTDPWSVGTNWMQTIFYFDQPLSVSDGSLYYGGIEFCPTKINGELDDIIVNFELLKGDPIMVDFEMDMRWRMKPAIMQNEDSEEKIVEKENNEDEIYLEDKNEMKITASTENILKSIDFLSLNLFNNTVIQNEHNETDEGHLIKPLASTTVHSTTCLNWCQLTNNNTDSIINCDTQSLKLGNLKYPYRQDRRGKNKRNKKGNSVII